MAYKSMEFKNFPDESTPINAENLNNIIAGIDENKAEIAKKAYYKNISYNAGGTGGLNTACDVDTLYNVYFQVACNNVAQGTRGILFAIDENTQILITHKGNIHYRYYNETDDIWGDFTSIISKKVGTVNGIAPDESGNV
ncbi:MAG: hypothetical protein ACI4RM_02920, partial [Ruminococcus sp.]